MVGKRKREATSSDADAQCLTRVAASSLQIKLEDIRVMEDAATCLDR